MGATSLRRRPCTPWIARNCKSLVTERSLCRSWGGTVSTSKSRIRRRAHSHFSWSVAVLIQELAHGVHSFHHVCHSVKKIDHAPHLARRI